jgi:tyrosine-protein kinase Etk/Wzc
MIQNEPLVEDAGADPFETETEVSVLDILVLLSAEKKFLWRFALGAAVLATIAAFVLPVRYEAKVVLMPPQQNSSISSAMLGQLGGLGSLASLAGGGLGLKNSADMYVALVTSRTVEDALIQRFGLMQEYREKRMSDTREKLESRTTAIAGAKDGLIRITVEDRDPKRAAELANGYVEEFRRLSASLAITEAARRRLFFEQQLEQTKNNLASAEEAMKKTEDATGILQIDSQARSLIEAAAILRGQVVAKQVQIQGMRSFAAEGNPELVLAKQELSALQSQLDRLTGSQPDGDTDLMLSKKRATGAGLEYIRKYRDVKYQETLFQLLAKEFELAKLDEAREGAIVQVVDSGVMPDRRSSPHRLLIILGTTILALFVAAFWVVFRAGLGRTLEQPENRERLESIKLNWQGQRGGE